MGQMGQAQWGQWKNGGINSQSSLEIGRLEVPLADYWKQMFGAERAGPMASKMSPTKPPNYQTKLSTKAF